MYINTLHAHSRSVLEEVVVDSLVVARRDGAEEVFGLTTVSYALPTPKNVSEGEL